MAWNMAPALEERGCRHTPVPSSPAAGLSVDPVADRATVGHHPVMQGEMQPPSHADLVADLRVVREKGLGHLRRYTTPALTVACQLYGAATDEANRPAAVETLVKQAVARLGGGRPGEAAEYTFGLVAGTRLWNSADRRRAAAKAHGVSVERFRKGYEGALVEQVAEGVLLLLHDGTHNPVRPDIEFAASLPSAGELALARKLQQAGVVDFHLSRADYRLTLAQFLEQARSSIVMVSISLKTKGAENEVLHVFRRSLSRWPQFRIIVSLVKPDSPACEAAAVILGTSYHALQAEIESMCADLTDLKKTLTRHESARLYLLQHTVLPSFSCVLIDDGLPTAQLQVEAKLYEAPRSDSYGFTLTPGGDLYGRQRRAYYRILRDAEPFPCDSERPVLPTDL
jgi:hypothetical protein